MRARTFVSRLHEVLSINKSHSTTSTLVTSLIDTKLPTERTTEDSTADVGVNALLRELQQCLQTADIHPGPPAKCNRHFTR